MKSRNILRSLAELGLLALLLSVTASPATLVNLATDVRNILSNSHGGTGQDSSSSTGVPHVSSGSWSFGSIVTGDIASNAVTSAKVDGSVGNSTTGAFGPLTDGSTVTWAIGSAYEANADLTFTAHGGSRTLNITGPVNGGTYVLWIKQDGTGGEGLTLGTGCTWKVGGGGSGAIAPSTAANAIDVLAFSYDGTNCYANFNKNFN